VFRSIFNVNKSLYILDAVGLGSLTATGAMKTWPSERHDATRKARAGSIEELMGQWLDEGDLGDLRC